MDEDEVIGVNYVSDVAHSFSGTLDSLDLINKFIVSCSCSSLYCVV